jgi:hypothetical protein
VRSRRNEEEPEEIRGRPAITSEGRENQLIHLAMELAEKRIRDGTASAQEITHFLKLGSSREKLEQERLRQENKLIGEKTAALANAKQIEELMRDALNAMRMYSGDRPSEPEYYDD